MFRYLRVTILVAESSTVPPQMREVSSIARDGRTYSLAQVINRAAGLALLPLYTHLLHPDEFGVYTLVISTLDLLAVLSGLGLTTAMNRFYLEFPDDAPMRRQVVGTAVCLVGGLAAVLLLLCWPLGVLVSHALFGNDARVAMGAAAVAAVAMIALFELICAYAVVRRSVRHYLWLSCAKAAALLAANGVMVGLLHGGALAAVASTAVAIGAVVAIALPLMLRSTGLQFRRGLARQMFRYGMPLVPSALAAAASGVIERYYLNSAAGAAAVGIYSLAHRLSSLLQMFIAAPFSQTYTVRRMESLVRGTDQGVYNRILLLFVLLMSLCSLALSVFAVDLVALLAPGSYGDAAQLVPLLGLCVVLGAINFNLETGIHFTKRTWALPVIAAVTLLVSMPLNAMLAHRHGAIGTAMALLLVQALRLVLTFFANASLGSTDIRLDWPRALSIMGATLAVALAAVAVEAPPLHPAWLAMKSVLVLAVAGLLLASPMVGAAVRDDLRSMWQRRQVQGGAE